MSAGSVLPIERIIIVKRIATLFFALSIVCAGQASAESLRDAFAADYEAMVVGAMALMQID